MTTAAYNGWTNRETWLANLWLTNEVRSYNFLEGILRRYETNNERASNLEYLMRDEMFERREEPELDMWDDLLATAFDRINWIEIVEENL